MAGLLSVPAGVAEQLYGVSTSGTRQLFAAKMRTTQKGIYHASDAPTRVFMPDMQPGDGGLDDLLLCTKARIEDAREAIGQGRNDILPFRGSKTNACTYCDFRSICGFDEQQPGMQVRRLRKPETGFRAMLAAEAERRGHSGV